MIRARLTAKEKELLLRLCYIADIAPLGEGDYQDWTERDSERLQSIIKKLEGR